MHAEKRRKNTQLLCLKGSRRHWRWLSSCQEPKRLLNVVKRGRFPAGSFGHQNSTSTVRCEVRCFRIQAAKKLPSPKSRKLKPPSRSKGIPPLKDALINEPEDHLKAAW